MRHVNIAIMFCAAATGVFLLVIQATRAHALS
jgi:hypothetical protein